VSQQVTVTTVCDLPALGCEHEADRTVRFGIGGRNYEADLCEKAAKAFAEDLRPFIDAARPVRPVTWRKRPTATRRRSAAIRAWALEQGLVDARHGRIAGSVVARYDAAHGARS
jgi:hypothetical protein